MRLNKKTWRINTQPWTDREGRPHTRIELVAPGYYSRVDKGVEERLAEPKPIPGPFTLSRDGNWYTYLIDDNARELATIYLCGPRDPEQQLKIEEGLKLGEAILGMLNGEGRGAGELDGPFHMHNNGYGNLQIISDSDEMVAALTFHGELGASGLEPEEALWLGQTIIKGLNGGSERDDV